MEVREEAEESSERVGKAAPGGGSVRRSFSSFCIRRFNLAHCAILPVLFPEAPRFECEKISVLRISIEKGQKYSRA